MGTEYIPDESWDKQSVYKLNNGWKATVEHINYYGYAVTMLDGPNGENWQCCNGLDGIPEFATGWVSGEIVKPDWL